MLDHSHISLDLHELSVHPGFESGAATSASNTRQRELDSVMLLAGAREIIIRHGGECYRLRHTRNDKLILTK